MLCLLVIMDNMLEENKNLKSHVRDVSSPSTLQGGDSGWINSKSMSFSLTYSKSNKLISALYMVTDIMDKDEPLRSKLRNLGANIISDIHSFNKGQVLTNQINNRVSEVLSFLEIASSIGIISEMNSGILTKEFIELRKSIPEIDPKNEGNWLEEFMKEDPYLTSPLIKGRNKESVFSKGQISTRIGVQKGSTLLKALSDRIPDLSRTNKMGNINNNSLIKNSNVDVLKNKRREEIILVIKDKMKNSTNFDGVTITEIKSNGHEALTSCGEKTLQRELVSMVLSGVLKKTGEKRWSKYLLN